MSDNRRQDRDQTAVIMKELDEAFRRVRRLITAEWHKYNTLGLGIMHGRILTTLAEKGPQKVSAIADTLNITSGAVTGMADRLVELELLNRERGEQDRRIVLLQITDDGRKLVAELDARRKMIMEKLFKNMSVDEMVLMRGFFQKMIANFCGSEA